MILPGVRGLVVQGLRRERKHVRVRARRAAAPLGRPAAGARQPVPPSPLDHSAQGPDTCEPPVHRRGNQPPAGRTRNTGTQPTAPARNRLTLWAQLWYHNFLPRPLRLFCRALGSDGRSLGNDHTRPGGAEVSSDLQQGVLLSFSVCKPLRGHVSHQRQKIS